MTIDPIRHYALTALATVHDEEAMTALELMGRQGNKINELVKQTNDNTKEIETKLKNLPQLIEDEVLERTTAEFENVYQKMDDVLATIPGEGETDVRPGTVKNGSIVSGMLGSDLLELRQNHYIVMAGKWTGGDGYYDKDSLNFVPHSGYTASAKIPVSFGQYYKITSSIYGGLVHPVALFDRLGRCVGVRGTAGSGEWRLVTDDIYIDRSDITHIQVITGAGYVSNCRVEYYDMKNVSLHEMNIATREHWHIHAKKRTDTVTDRAQIKCWYKLPAGHTVNDEYRISFCMSKYQNIAAEGITVRLFASVSDSTYDQQLAETAAGYTFLRSRALDCVDLHIPEELSDGRKVTHVSFFMDFLPENGENYLDAWLIPPVLERVTDGTKLQPIDPQIHGGTLYDCLNIVRPGAALTGAHRKTLLGLGDSLMKGNTLDRRFSWLNIAGGALDMNVINYAENGQPVQDIATSIVEIITGMNPDYVIVQGGANDKRLNISLGSFRAAIRSIILHIQELAPRAKILFATNWHRTEDSNSLGLYDWEYVQAMLEECEDLHVPCVNNYKDGLSLLAAGVKEWADEGIVSTGEANIHFSKEANEWIADRYISELMKL